MCVCAPSDCTHRDTQNIDTHTCIRTTDHWNQSANCHSENRHRSRFPFLQSSIVLLLLCVRARARERCVRKICLHFQAITANLLENWLGFASISNWIRSQNRIVNDIIYTVNQHSIGKRCNLSSVSRPFATDKFSADNIETHVKWLQ